MLLLIADDAPLGPEWLEHSLQGAWKGCRECHIGGDFLLIYHLAGAPASDLIVFVHAGTHADLFE
jgi:mRNA interferase YafQ